MQTSYFAKFRGEGGVSIALKTPDGFKGKSYPDLFPKWWFLSKYLKEKHLKDREADYIKAYHSEVLSKLDPQKVWNDLKGCTLLCWEAPGKFCHRHLVAEWLKNRLGVEVTEVRFENSPKKTVQPSLW